jgi:hypothetical protein
MDYMDQVAAFLNTVHKRSADGTTVAELAQNTVDAMRLTMSLLETVSSLSGEEKKAEVLKLVAYVFDTYSDSCVPLLAKPLWWIAKPALRAIVMQVASGVVESLLSAMRAQ